MGQKALDTFLNEYEWDITPSIDHAKKYADATEEEIKNCTKEDEISYKLLYDYKTILRLIGVARDYCFAAQEALKSISNK